MEVTIKKVLPLYPTEVFIQWAVDLQGAELSGFRVYKSGSPEGPFEDISGELPEDTFFHIDKPAHTFGLTTLLWYKIEAIPDSGPANSVFSDVLSAEYQEEKYRGRIARKARRDLGIVLNRLNGVTILVLKKKRFGRRCTLCYNEVTKDSMISHCPTCYGTTFLGGYHTPIKIKGKFDPKAINQAIDMSGLTEVNMHGVVMLDYPVVEPEDILVEVQTNRRYVVVKKMQTEGSRVLVHQDLQVSELARTAPEYNIPVELVP